MARPHRYDRSGRVRRAGALLGGLLGPTLRRQGFAQTEIVTRWGAIVGPELARVCLPERLAFPRRQTRGATLHLRVAGAYATELQHRAPQVIEQINTFFGYPAVARLALTQGPMPAAELPAAPAPAPLPAPAVEEIETAVAPTRDADLKAALARLGRRVLARNAADPTDAAGIPGATPDAQSRSRKRP